MRYSNLHLVLLGLLSASKVAMADVRLPPNASTARWLNAYTQAAKLPAIGTRGAEIRVWVIDVMLGDVAGFVVSDAGVTECDSRIDIPQSGFVIKRTKCKPSSTLNSSRRALALLQGLAKLDGKSLGCGWQDGDDVLVEGASTTGRFVFDASNPGFCKDPGSRLVTKLLMILRRG